MSFTELNNTKQKRTFWDNLLIYAHKDNLEWDVMLMAGTVGRFFEILVCLPQEGFGMSNHVWRCSPVYTDTAGILLNCLSQESGQKEMYHYGLSYL